MYYFTYQTINEVNGKTYIGVHKTKTLNDGYIGNGINTALNGQKLRRDYSDRKEPFARAVLKYGCHNFKRHILAFFDTYEEALEEEAFLVDADWVKSKDNYNVYTGGNQPRVISEEERERRSKWMKELNSRPVTEQQKKSISLRQKGVKKSKSSIEKMRKSLTKYDYTEIAKEIAPMLERGMSESQIKKATGYSNGCIYRSKRCLEQLDIN